MNVCWVYNEHVERWVKDLPEPVQRHVREGKTTDRTGPFAHFPHYLTRGQNPDALIRLTAAQVNLLAHLSSWNIIERQDDLRELLRSV